MNEKKFPWALKYGVMLGLTSIILTVLLHMLGLEMNRAVGSITGIGVSILFLVLCLKAYRDHNQGMSYGEGVGLGTLTGVVSSAISAVFTYVFYKFINPEMIDKIHEMTLEELEDREGLTDEQIDQAMEMTAMFTGPEVMSVFALLGGIFFAFILSLVIAAILKKERRPSFLD